MRIDKPILEGILLRRYKRFLADIELDDGTQLTAHCPNPGGMLGCKEPGSRVALRDSQDPKRKLRYTFQTILVGDTWVNVDTGLPNALVFEAVEADAIPELTGYDTARREVKYGQNSRIDILLERESGERCYVEVKNTTLARGTTALFPDAKTARGLKHLGELADMVREGHRAVQFFLVSRDDVNGFAPADDIDPAYGAGLREAAAAGVELLAYSTHATPSTLEIVRSLPVELDAPVRT